MNITKITKKSGNKYELIIDKKKHIISGDVLLKYQLLKPGEISEELFNEIIKCNNGEQVYGKILNFISFKIRSEKEVRDKLYTLVTSGEQLENILDRLRREGYLNNDKYIESFINDRITLTLYGPNRIKNDLIKKGFSISQIEKLLDLVDFETWNVKCSKIIDKMVKTFKNGSNKANISKLRRNLINNGYEPKYFNNLLDNLVLDDSNNLKKDYMIYKNKLSKKYSGDVLEYKIKEKLYSKGYDISKLNM